ncbi:hypothetical protein L208DRAFT_1325686, partial [Tricholoma matsutake]
SPSFHLFAASFSSCVRLSLLAASGVLLSFSMYFSNPRSWSMASICHFHGIQL